MAQNNSIDLVVTDNEELKNYLNEDQRLFVATDCTRGREELEVFVKGHEIPWSFEQPSWYMPWTTFYSMSDEFGRTAHNWYANRFNNIDLPDETIELLRSLLMNRVSNICYTKDKLLFYAQQRRYSKRNEWERQDFSFECSYYLSHYYISLWGGLDQLGRILRDTLDIPLSDSRSSFGNEDFINRINENSEDLGNIFTDDDFEDWIEQLQRNRHFVAHEGTVLLQPILNPPEEELTEEEIQERIESQPNYDSMRRGLPDQLFEWYEANLRNQIIIDSHEVATDEAMVMEGEDGEQLIFRPMRNIRWDFSHFETTILETLEILYEFLEEN